MVQPYVAGAASALTGFIHMGWAFIISFLLANIENITTIHLGVSQTATAVGSTIAFLFLVKLFHFRLKNK
jgi:hypothetical protein